jgi:hypothetical protein
MKERGLRCRRCWCLWPAGAARARSIKNPAATEEEEDESQLNSTSRPIVMNQIVVLVMLQKER